jgi:coniferyl-aldehyde dehydrogenase
MNPLYYDLEQHKQAFLADPYTAIAGRKDRIQRLITMLDENEENFCKVIAADFGFRHPIETQLAEIISIRQEASFTLNNLHRWVKPVTVKTPSHLFPSKSYLFPQAKGVVGIMSPWNYPLSLALIPTISALAAGNRVWLKPSDRSPRTSGYLATLITQYFNPTEIHVVNGGPETSENFASLSFDHLLFTGSTATGRLVAKAAGENLTPLTLELGGKSPAILDSSVSMKHCVPRLLYGKLFNSGQTCIAPDYVLVPHTLRDTLISQLKLSFTTMYAEHTQLTNPIDQAQQLRWSALLDDAQKQGAQLIPLGEVNHPLNTIMPTLVLDPSSTLKIMQEEIFGPILPIISYSDLSEAIAFIQSRPKPLAMYWYGNNQEKLNTLLEKTSAGGVTVNDSFLHFSNHYLPFGGIGSSGMGSYHGKHGFDTFTHYKPVFSARSFLGFWGLSGTKSAHPPYGKAMERVLKMLRKK